MSTSSQPSQMLEAFSCPNWRDVALHHNFYDNLLLFPVDRSCLEPNVVKIQLRSQSGGLQLAAVCDGPLLTSFECIITRLNGKDTVLYKAH